LPWFRARLRRGAAIAIAASTVFGTHHASALAQDAPPEDGDEPIELVGWDLSDPVNHAESREFFAGLWAAEDAGLPPPQFEFTNTPPGLMLAMLLPELEVFTEIYGHRLQLDFDAAERYLVTDLIADDAEVRAEFRAFVLTGKLAPRPEIDAAAYLTHYQLVLDAVTVQQRASVVSVESLGMLLESEGLSVEASSPLADEPPFPSLQAPDAGARWLCALKYLSAASRLQCLVGAGLYKNHRSTVVPDFDCDDLADAMIRFLEKRLPPGTDIQMLALYWNCGTYQAGHGVVIIQSPEGNWYWIEPGTNVVHGPFALERTATLDAFDHLSSWQALANCQPRVSLCRRFRPKFGKSYSSVEAPPWYTSPVEIMRFCERLRECCAQVIALRLEDTGCVPADFVQLPFHVNACSIGDYTPTSPEPDSPGQVPPNAPPAIWSQIPCTFPAFLAP
jgi:hypothetical protein